MSIGVIGFGALNVDKLYEVSRIACGDEESFVTGLSESCGGSAANTIVALAKLGVKTGFIGKIAEDREGELHLEEFKEHGVDTEGIVISEEGRSGKAIGFVDDNGERALYIDPGVNDELESDEVDMEYAKRADFIHMTSFVGDKSLARQIEMAEKLEGDVKITFDPGMLYAQRGIDALKPILRRTYVIMPSERELSILTGEDYEQGAQKLVEEGPEVVAVKLGDKGCYVTEGMGGFQVDPFQVEPADTTGAGDAFSAGFIYGLKTGKNLRKCAELGNFVASRCIKERGARGGLPVRSDLEKD